jgi:hypothetical protein
MGMHVGFVAANRNWMDLKAALQEHCGTFEDQGEVSTPDWFDLPSGQDVFHVAEHGGQTYMLDPAMVLSANADFIVALASGLSRLVVGAGAETVSGTFWLTAADNDAVKRVHFNVAATLSEPFDLGTPLPSESRVAWDDLDGEGVLARIADLGFDREVFERGAAGGRRVLWRGEKFPGVGDLGRRINQHCEVHKRANAEDWMKNITVQVREGGGYDLRAGPGRAPKQSGLRGLFKRGR